MAIYIYEGKFLNGSVTKGKLYAINKEDVNLLLRERGIFPITIVEEGQGSSLGINFKRKIPYKDLAIFSRQMHFALTAGIPMLRTLDMVKEQIENVKLKNILAKVYEEVQKGSTLSEVLSKYNTIPYMFTAMVEVGEATGRIDNIMGELAEYYDKQHRQEKKISNALTYPKFLLGFSLLIVITLVTFVVPIFVEGILSSGQDLPAPTKIIVAISDFIKGNFLILILIVIGIIIMKSIFVDNNEYIKYRIDRYLIKGKYIANISKQIFSSRFARTFGILIDGGMNVMEALTISANAVDNLYIKSAIEECKGIISSGMGIGIALENKEIFPRMLTQMIKVGEETGSLDNILKKTSEYYEIEADFAIQKLTSLIEPIMIVGLAFIVGFVVISLALPMFQIMGAI